MPDPLALIAPGNSKLLGFDFPIGLPIAYASQAGIDDFRSFLPEFGQGEWESFYLPATTPDEISLRRPFYPRRPGGTKQQHLIEALGVSSMNDERARSPWPEVTGCMSDELVQRCRVESAQIPPK